MLTIKASAKPSKINGIGLIADERIPKGTVTWRFNKTFDLQFEPDDVVKMPKEHQDLIYKYAFLSMTTGKYIFCIDDSRFTNHSIHNNIDSIPFDGELETLGVANRDVEIGEELLVNYRTFDVADKNSKENYLEK
jgi:SET domain-containing protein